MRSTMTRRRLVLESLEQRTVLCAPTAVGDVYYVDHGDTLEVEAPGVTANDDTGIGPISATLVEGPEHGSITFNADGSFEYTPDAGFAGTDSFLYEISNSCGTSQEYAFINVENEDPEWEADTFADWLIDDWSGAAAELSGMAVGQLQATNLDGDPLTYSLAEPSPYFAVDSDGTVRVSGASALIDYFQDDENHQSIATEVQVTDGIKTVLGEFILGVKTGFIDQSEIYIETTVGTIYRPETAAQFKADLETIRTNGQIIKLLIIKGHGSPYSIDAQDELLTAPETAGNNQILLGFDDITQLLKDVTNGSSTISLRGCRTRALALRVQARLDGADVYGALMMVLGVPGTTIGVGVYHNL